MEIRLISNAAPEYAAVYELRDRVLRQPLGLSLGDEDLSGEVREFTLAAVSGEKVLGCVMLRPLEHGELKLRQMAVDTELQGRQIGAQLVHAAESLARTRGFNHITLHARDTALGFYERLGYQVDGQGFEEVGVPHHFMHKYL